MTQPAASSSGQALEGEILAKLSRLDAPPERFLIELLAAQCGLAGAQAGAIIRAGDDGEPTLLAAWPELSFPAGEETGPPEWLGHAAAAAARIGADSRPLVIRLTPSGAFPDHQARIVLTPIHAEGSLRAVAAFHFAGEHAPALSDGVRRLESIGPLLQLYESRLTLHRSADALRRLRDVMSVLAAAGERDRFSVCAMTLCNEVAARWRCERAALGFLHSRESRLAAISHSERVVRTMGAVQAIEQAQEECLDQDVEIVYPTPPDSTNIDRAAAALSALQAGATVLTLPLRRKGEPVAALTCERPAGDFFSPDEVESLRLLCDLCAPRLTDMHAADRWLGARIAADARRSLAAVLGPEHTWMKVGGVALAAALAFATFARTTETADATFSLEAIQRQVTPAPFDGFLKDVRVAVGDTVVAGETIMGDLDTSELRLQLAAAKAERAIHQKEAAAAMRDTGAAQAQIAQARADKAGAAVELLELQIARAELKAGLSGMVVAGDLARRVGAPVRTGETLLEIAPIESLRAELSVPEGRIADVRIGQQGELAAAAFPGRRVPFIVERITPVAEVRDRGNVFIVRARLLSVPDWMRPGMQGVAKIDLARRSYLAVWSRPIVDWLRMRLWL